ncbi:hypothetical protein CYMTET_10945 [Cymbomonas tetramitiformis]|uniref:Reverse transcriptase n=1 Tax=Cymbomonas tetramitiformis TaxID=36881 RepID=A0AAE0LDY8_9CHLO|nr:hypothetical protein CYMTET_10945 [Cymbomonas tetramitiformis]
MPPYSPGSPSSDVGASAETPPEGTRPEEPYRVTPKMGMDSPDRDMLRAVEEAENADPIDGLCGSMLQLDLGESELQNLSGVPQRAVDAYRSAAPARRRKRNSSERAARQRGKETRGNQGQTNAEVVAQHMGAKVECPPQEILQDKSIPGISNEFWKVLPPNLRSLILRCRFEVLMTAARKHLFRPDKYPSPDCALCGKRDSPTHRLSGCGQEASANMTTARHNEVARILYKAIRVGRTGASPIWITHHARPEAAQREDVDEIHLIEVAFTWDTRWYMSLHEKINKYEPLMELLRAKGCKVFFHLMVFGTTGSVYEHNERVLTQYLGFKRKEAEALLRKISSTSVEWAAKMLVSHNKSEKEEALKNSKKPP